MLTIIKLIIYYFAYQVGFSAVMTGINLFIAPLSTATMTSLTMVASTLMMSWHLLHFGYVRLAHDRYKEVTPAVWAVAVIFIIAAMYVLNLVIEQIGIPNTMEETFIAMSRNPWGALSIALLAPILEEFLFRGAIQGYLQEMNVRPWKAIVAASLIFGVTHLNPAQIPFAFLLGMIFGWLYYRTGSLLPGIVGHVLNNSVATINMIANGNETLAEQIQNPLLMWTWAIVAAIACCLAALWLNKNIAR